MLSKGMLADWHELPNAKPKVNNDYDITKALKPNPKDDVYKQKIMNPQHHIDIPIVPLMQKRKYKETF